MTGYHIHAIWRKKGNEFGEDVLKKTLPNEKALVGQKAPTANISFLQVGLNI